MRRMLIGLFLALIILYVILALFMARLKPEVALLANAEARREVTSAIDAAIADEVRLGELTYDNLVGISTDAAGNVTALVTDMATINTLQVRISGAVEAHILTSMNSKMTIPLGNLSGNVMFSNRGPQIPVKIKSIVDISSQFTNEFTSVGINQTRHKIMLEVTAVIDILIPGNTTRATVTKNIAVAETIIVGNVPNVYAGGQG